MELVHLIFEKNPGLANLILSGFLLPVAILWITGRNSRRMKEIEKKIELNYNSKEDVRKQEKTVYASLSKILFDVQQLHVALSGTCVDNACINEALQKFDMSVSKYHEEISDNLLFMSSVVINNIYRFYNSIGQLKSELKELNAAKDFEMAHVAVYYASQRLAEILIEVQEQLVTDKTDLKVKFDKTRQEMMKYCCGRKPPEALTHRYNELRQALLAEQV